MEANTTGSNSRLLAKARSTASLSLGPLFEQIAAEYIRNRGYEILERNVRFGHLEADLIAQDQSVLVLVEVRGRAGTRFSPSKTLHPRKLAHLRSIAQMLARRRRCPIRVELIEVIAKAGFDVKEPSTLLANYQIQRFVLFGPTT